MPKPSCKSGQVNDKYHPYKCRKVCKKNKKRDPFDNKCVIDMIPGRFYTPGGKECPGTTVPNYLKTGLCKSRDNMTPREMQYFNDVTESRRKQKLAEDYVLENLREDEEPPKRPNGNTFKFPNKTVTIREIGLSFSDLKKEHKRLVVENNVLRVRLGKEEKRPTARFYNRNDRNTVEEDMNRLIEENRQFSESEVEVENIILNQEDEDIDERLRQFEASERRFELEGRRRREEDERLERQLQIVYLDDMKNVIESIISDPNYISDNRNHILHTIDMFRSSVQL